MSSFLSCSLFLPLFVIAVYSLISAARVKYCIYIGLKLNQCKRQRRQQFATEFPHMQNPQDGSIEFGEIQFSSMHNLLMYTYWGSTLPGDGVRNARGRV